MRKRNFLIVASREGRDQARKARGIQWWVVRISSTISIPAEGTSLKHVKGDCLETFSMACYYNLKQKLIKDRFWISVKF